jgi:hypothetical protein
MIHEPQICQIGLIHLKVNSKNLLNKIKIKTVLNKTMIVNHFHFRLRSVDIDKGALFLVLYGLIIVFNRLDQFFRSLKINRVQVKITASLTH